MMNWHPEVQELLDNQDYQALVNYYEKLVENEPEDANNYCYLGLAYLLNEQEEEAQLTWLFPLSQAENINQLTLILQQEAERQENLEQDSKAWLIRSQIRELEPDNLNNLLLLIKLALKLSIFQKDLFYKWNVFDLLDRVKSQVIELKLLLDILDKILFIKEEETLQFARFCLIYSNSHPDIIKKIHQIGQIIGFQHHYVNYAIELILICREFNEYELSIYLDLHELYIWQEDYNKAIEIINIFGQKATSFEDKILVTCYLLNTYPKLANWSKAQQQADDLLNYCQQIIATKYTFNSLSHRNYFYQALINFLYFKDDLIFHRYLFQEISLLFDKSIKEKSKINLVSNLTKDKKILKIGYIGTTFRTHSVGFLSRWLIHHHNHDLFEINIYSVITHEDEITIQWFQPPKVRQFYHGEGNLDQLTKKIMADEIDILVDLDSLTSSLTASVLLEKPVPIQITWLGLDASGLPTIDYYIADPYVLGNNAQQYYREKIWRLPDTYLAIDGFEIGIPSLRKEDLGIPTNSIVFMNLQHSKKLNPDILRSQLKIVKAVPNSYLMIKKTYDDKALCHFILEIAKSENVSTEKIVFIPPETLNVTHRANLQIADVVLDTYPYNGSTTTLEALWSEIPVVTRVGEQFAARNSYTYMVNAGITEGIAWSEEEYIEWGIKLGRDENLRKEVSWKLKQSKKTSPLWNGKQFAREMEKAYRQMWEIYVQEK